MRAESQSEEAEEAQRKSTRVEITLIARLVHCYHITVIIRSKGGRDFDRIMLHACCTRGVQTADYTSARFLVSILMISYTPVHRRRRRRQSRIGRSLNIITSHKSFDSEIRARDARDREELRAA
jgi:hypothetical protein